MTPSLGAQIEQFTADVGELVEAHATSVKARDYTRYADDPVGFIRDVLHAEPWSRQEEIAELVRDHPLVSIRSANSIGKDYLAARLALWWVYARRGFVLCTGPTDRQVKTVVMGEVHRAFARAKDLPGKLFEMALRLDGEEEQRGILAFTSNEASRLTGFHAPRVLVILTEAQALDPWVWEGVLACATGADSRVLAVGNPLFPTGRFFEVARSQQWECRAIPANEHPNVIARREVIPGAVTVEWIERMAQEWGRTSQIYRSRVLAEFPDDSLEALIKRSWLDAAVARYESRELETLKLAFLDLVAALDPARFGADKTALAVRQGPILRHLVVWSQADTMQTVGLALQQLQQLKAPLWTWEEAKWAAPGRRTRLLVIDECGLGAGCLDRLKEQSRPVEGFNGGRTPIKREEEERYANERAASYWHLRTLLESGKIAMPRDPILFDELTAMQWKVASNGKVIIENKDELKSRLGRSPDRADAVAMCFAEYERTRYATFTSVRVRMG